MINQINLLNKNPNETGFTIVTSKYEWSSQKKSYYFEKYGILKNVCIELDLNREALMFFI